MHKVYFLFFSLVLLVSCHKEQVFNESPSQRLQQGLDALRSELTSAEHGWLMTYYPKTDSLLYASTSAHIRQDDYGAHLAGYGGYCFAVKFSPEGKVTMLADRDAKQIITEQTSSYEVRQMSSAGLSFTSYNYIHDLINVRLSGKSDFIYVGKDMHGDLLFKTDSYIEPAREYILLKRLNKAEDWHQAIARSYEHRTFFEKMKQPYISIRKGDRVFYRSDYPLRTDPDETMGYIKNRYYLFLFAAQLKNHPGAYPLQMRGLGSGYTGTESGLSFYSGIRYSKDYVFHHFERVGDKFVSRVVRIFDPVLRKYRYVSHLDAPEGEPTGIMAEIYDTEP